jgi:3-hydroxyacyl-CoA dehydrogenase
MHAEGARSFYRAADRLGFPHTEYFDLAGSVYQPLETRPGVIVLSEVKRARGVVEKNAGASLIDIGDGVLCLEFHSKMNAIGEDALRMIDKAVQLLPERFDAMVIANEGENFSVGANLVLLLAAAQAGEFGELEQTIDHFQQCMLRIKYAPRPVVAGGCRCFLSRVGWRVRSRTAEPRGAGIRRNLHRPRRSRSRTDSRRGWL